MGHIVYGYKLNERGRVIHQRFDSDDLFHGNAKAQGWVDSPSKIPGAVQAMQAEAAAKKSTAHTKAPEPAMTGAVYGEKRKPGRPRKS
jgi:hypothetical protein